MKNHNIFPRRADGCFSALAFDLFAVLRQTSSNGGIFRGKADDSPAGMSAETRGGILCVPSSIGLATRFGKSIGKTGESPAYPRLVVRLWTCGGFHERDNLSDRTYRGGYGHFFILGLH